MPSSDPVSHRRCHPWGVPWRSLIAWLLVLPIAGVGRAAGVRARGGLPDGAAARVHAARGGGRGRRGRRRALLLRRRAAALRRAAARRWRSPRSWRRGRSAGRAAPRAARAAAARADREPLPAAARRARASSRSCAASARTCVSLQEVTPRVAAALEDAGLRRAAARARAGRPRGGGFGSAVYARAAARSARRAPEGQTVTVARVRGARRAAGRGARRAPAGAAAARPNMAEWRADLRALPPATPRGAVRILAGDFNATLDHAELRRVLDRGYEDAADEVGHGLRATWPAEPPDPAAGHDRPRARRRALRRPRPSRVIDVPRQRPPRRAGRARAAAHAERRDAASAASAGGALRTRWRAPAGTPPRRRGGAAGPRSSRASSR